MPITMPSVCQTCSTAVAEARRPVSTLSSTVA